MMSKTTLAAMVGAGLMVANAGTALAEDSTLVRVSSPHSVSETIDKLSAAVENAGAKVFARIDHAKGGKSVDMEIPDNEVLIFGNPKLGTPIIRDAQAAGLDLPIRVSAIETPDGTIILYRSPVAFAGAHGLPEDHPSVVAMTGALKKLTSKAAE